MEILILLLDALRVFTWWDSINWVLSESNSRILQWCVSIASKVTLDRGLWELCLMVNHPLSLNASLTFVRERAGHPSERWFLRSFVDSCLEIWVPSEVDLMSLKFIRDPDVIVGIVWASSSGQHVNSLVTITWGNDSKRTLLTGQGIQSGNRIELKPVDLQLPILKNLTCHIVMTVVHHTDDFKMAELSGDQFVTLEVQFLDLNLHDRHHFLTGQVLSLVILVVTYIILGELRSKRDVALNWWHRADDLLGLNVLSAYVYKYYLFTVLSQSGPYSGLSQIG